MATPPVGEKASKGPPAASEGSGGPGGVKVSSYTKGNGIKVTEHERGPPAGGKRERTPPKDKDPKDGKEKKEDAEAPPKRLMTVDEYLEMTLREQREAVIAESVAGDPAKQELVDKDEAANAPPPEPPGRTRFLADMLEEARQQGIASDHNVNAIRVNVLAGRYNDVGGDWGKMCLIPHLQLAGCFRMAERVAEGEYRY